MVVAAMRNLKFAGLVTLTDSSLHILRSINCTLLHKALNSCMRVAVFYVLKCQLH